MHFRMVAPPEVEAEGLRLYDEWSKLPPEVGGDFDDYLEKHSSEAAKAYMREYEEVYSQLKPGEYV